jgi:four helix bundle suffix protein
MTSNLTPGTRRFKQDSSHRLDVSDLKGQQRRALYTSWLEHDGLAVRADAIICLIREANFLLDHQIAALERGFAEQGGYSGQPAAARLAFRGKN